MQGEKCLTKRTYQLNDVCMSQHLINTRFAKIWKKDRDDPEMLQLKVAFLHPNKDLGRRYQSVFKDKISQEQGSNHPSPSPMNQTIEDCAKDGGEEFFTEMHCVRITNL